MFLTIVHYNNSFFSNLNVNCIFTSSFCLQFFNDQCNFFCSRKSPRIRNSIFGLYYFKVIIFDLDNSQKGRFRFDGRLYKGVPRLRRAHMYTHIQKNCSVHMGFTRSDFIIFNNAIQQMNYELRSIYKDC